MCLNPINITYRDSLGSHSIPVPCGKCIECLEHYQNDIKVRLFHEFEYRKKAVFVTLTYNEETVPSKAFYTKNDESTGEVIYSDRWKDGFIGPVSYFDGRAVDRDYSGNVKRGRDGFCRSVNKKDIQLWLKSVRSQYKFDTGEALDFSYYCTSEYSPVWLRPHYHIILFGIDLLQYQMLFSRKWTDRFGFDYVSEVDYDYTKGHSAGKVMNYVSKYCSKGSFENPRVAEGTVNPTFHLYSKGLGKNWVIDHMNLFVPDMKELSPFLIDTPFRYVVRSKPNFDVNGRLQSVCRLQHVKTITKEKNGQIFKFVKTSCFNYPARSRSIRIDYLQILAKNYIVPFPPSEEGGTSYLYRLPRYYKEFIKAVNPSVYCQVMAYQLALFEDKQDERRAALQHLYCISYGEADYKLQILQQREKNARARTRVRRLSEFYKSSYIQ